jgi:hypothetical protein
VNSVAATVYEDLVGPPSDVPVSPRTQVLTTVDQPPEFVMLVDRLREISKLPIGWDGNGSPALTSNARSSALRAIEILAGPLSQVSLPHVAPVPGGGVQFEAENGQRYFELEVLPSGSMQLLLTLGTECFAEKEVTESDLPAAVTWVRRI